MYDLCVIGAGLVGTGAAKHASKFCRVCLLGPNEPKDRTSSNQRDIYGSHYDEGRIYMQSTSDPVWAKLAQVAISRYPDIEKESGVQFYNDVGSMAVGTAGGDYISSVKTVAHQDGIKAQFCDAVEARELFPYLNIPDDDEVVYEPRSAGHISPRQLIRAQITIAKRHGCHHFTEVANSVYRRCDKDNSLFMEVTTDAGTKIQARKVIVATGAFTVFRNMLGTEVKHNIKLYPLAVTKLEISEKDAEKMKNMPSVIYCGKGNGWTKDFPTDIRSPTGFYMLPPIRYPDGKYYIKLGHSHDSVKKFLHTSKEVKDWFDYGPDAKLVKQMANMIESVVTGLTPLSYHGDSCVVEISPTTRPYIDKIHDNIGVAIANNGYAAKSSDEIGRLAVHLLMSDSWDFEFPQSEFRVQLLSGTENLLSKL